MRLATAHDAARLLQIYAPYVKETSITSEYDVPSLEEFKQRIAHTLMSYPYFVAELTPAEIRKDNPDVHIPREDNGMCIVGYVYAGPLKTRSAYQWSAETSIYVDASLRKLGIGKTMETALVRALSLQNITNVYAYITYPLDDKNPYVTTNSYGFHRHYGYSEVARLHKAQRKFDIWTDLVIMEKIIGKHTTSMEPFIPFPRVKDKVIDLLDRISQNERI